MLLPAPTPTEAAHAQALQLVERHGVVTREAVMAEGLVGGFSAVYGVLKVLEERGQVRRGYFVDGLGAAQFAVPGAVDRLRAVRETPDPVISPDDVPDPIVLASTDPAQPYGAALAWPRHVRSAGAQRLVDGRAARRDAARLVRPAGPPPGHVPRRASSTRRGPMRWSRSSRTDRLRSVEVRKIDGDGLTDAPAGLLEILRSAGFVDGYRGLTYRN